MNPKVLVLTNYHTHVIVLYIDNSMHWVLLFAGGLQEKVKQNTI